MQIALPLAQEEDRVADQLARPVIGDVAAALDLVERRVAEVEQVLAVGAAAGGDHVRVLDEDERVGDLVALARAHQLALQRPDLAEVAGAEIEEAGGRGWRRRHRF